MPEAQQFAYLHGSSHHTTGILDALWTTKVPCKESPLPWQQQGLSFTASGYGKRIPTTHMVFFNGRWRRVYVRIFSNAGTVFIGKLEEFGERITVQME